MQNDGRPWTPADDALLGSDTDRRVAHRLGRSSVAVSNRRVKLGISLAGRAAQREAEPSWAMVRMRVERAHSTFCDLLITTRSALERAGQLQLRIASLGNTPGPFAETIDLQPIGN